jgi:hypothetical protein
MRFFLNLSVGKKLAASALLAVAMLVGLVAATWEETGRVVSLQRDQAQADAAQERIAAGAGALRDVPVLLRDLLLTQEAAGLGPARERMLARLDDGMAELAAGMDAHGHPEVTAFLPRLRAASAEFRGALDALGAERTRLLHVRDTGFFAHSAEYDPVFEAVSGGISFEPLETETLEETRQRLMTLHTAVNDVRIGAQRMLASG